MSTTENSRKNSTDEKYYTCSICGKVFKGWGNNPYPVTKGENDRCCDSCNYEVVIPARLMGMRCGK